MEQIRAVSTNKDDGLILSDTYITNVVRCAPPNDKPLPNEIKNCRDYLRREISDLINVKVILTLGRKAFDQVKIILQENGADIKEAKFTHGAVYKFGDEFPRVVVSYHTSQRNIRRKIMSDEIIEQILETVTQELRNDYVGRHANSHGGGGNKAFEAGCTTCTSPQDLQLEGD